MHTTAVTTRITIRVMWVDEAEVVVFVFVIVDELVGVLVAVPVGVVIVINLVVDP